MSAAPLWAVLDRWGVSLLFFFFNDTATTEIYTLSLHDALPISGALGRRPRAARGGLALALGERQRSPRPRLRSALRRSSSPAARRRGALAAGRAAGGPSSGPPRHVARAAGAGPQRRVRRVHRGAGKSLVPAPPLRPARRTRGHGHGARSGQPRCLVRDHSRRLAALLAPAAGAGEIRMRIVQRTYAEADHRTLVEAGVHPLLARIYAARRIRPSPRLRT